MIWITLYEITVRASHDDEDLTANYLPMVINLSVNQWLLSLREGSIDTWSQLRRAFIDNYMATCQQPGNKYDLEKVRDYPNEPFHDYICSFSKTWISILDINSDKAISMLLSGPSSSASGLTQSRTCSWWQRSGQTLTRLTSRSRKTLAELLDPTDKITALMTGAMIGAVTTAAMIGATTTVTVATTIMIDVGRMTLGGGRTATN
jgi:hypothetical protein